MPSHVENTAAQLEAEVRELLQLNNGHGVKVKPRELPDDVAALVVCPPGPDLLLLVDTRKPGARHHALFLMKEFSVLGALGAMASTLGSVLEGGLGVLT